MYGDYFQKISSSHPLVFAITNTVTVNDVANVILACGASPVMSNAANEAVEMVNLSHSLLLNIGTPDDMQVDAMLLAGKSANLRGIPVILDPVGIGATDYRRNIVEMLLDQIHFSAIKGNTSEIKAMSGISTSYSRGVDANHDDIFSAKYCHDLAVKYQTIVIATGSTDIISDGRKCFAVGNGRPEMERITGTGCQLGGLLAAGLGTNPEDLLSAAIDLVAAMGIAGEIAWKNMSPSDGNATYRNRIIDAIYNMQAKTIAASIKVTEL